MFVEGAASLKWSSEPPGSREERSEGKGEAHHVFLLPPPSRSNSVFKTMNDLGYTTIISTDNNVTHSHYKLFAPWTKGNCLLPAKEGSSESGTSTRRS